MTTPVLRDATLMMEQQSNLPHPVGLNNRCVELIESGDYELAIAGLTTALNVTKQLLASFSSPSSQDCMAIPSKHHMESTTVSLDDCMKNRYQHENCKMDTESDEENQGTARLHRGPSYVYRKPSVSAKRVMIGC